VGAGAIAANATSGASYAFPPPVCGDGLTNQATEQCEVNEPIFPASGSDQSPCEVGKYCASNCTCQKVAPFADGTWIRTPNASVYRSVGGSPVYLTSCAKTGTFPGCPASFWKAPQEFVDALITLHPTPAAGSLVRRPDGAVFQIRNGRAEYVQSCAEVGGCSGLVDLDWAAVDRLGGPPPPSSHGWSDRHNLGGVLASEPSAALMPNSSLHVFVRGSDNALQQKFWVP